MTDRRPLGPRVLSSLAMLLGSCGSSTGVPIPDAGRPDAGPGPDVSSAWRYDECDPGTDRPRPSVVGWYTGCSSHAECIDGTNGRCIRAGPGEFWCTYDECFTSADCGVGRRCVCDVGPALQNLCLRADCWGPEDCGGLSCEVSWECAGPGEITYSASEILCHTRRDTCRSDADCAEEEFCTRGPLFGGPPLDHWRCELPTCGH